MKGAVQWAIVIFSSLGITLSRDFSTEDINNLREEVREMFHHAYDSYLKHAYPYDELRPLSCDGMDTWGSYSLTLIDALDTLAVMGNYTEFRRVVNLLVTNSDFFTNNINVSVFETNIRIIGGLLSAHLLSYKAGIEVETGWPCNGPLLELAETVARKLVAAFDTTTGMPYGTVNLQHGVPHNETTVTCTAGVGTFILEFSTLSQLTGDPLYEELAMNALHALWNHRSSIGLVGNHVDIESGRWTAHDAGIGAGIDSYFEYLAKGAIFLQKPELMRMFNEYKKKIEKYLKTEDWYMWASMTKGQVSLLVFQSLEAYWPGVLSLVGEIPSAMRTLHNYHQVWKQFGFTPEFYNIPQSETGSHRESYPLRPELIESVMYLYRATGDKYLLQVGEDILRSLQHSSYTPCGYATIKDVRDHRKDDRMESFFLAETTKYLYLLFDPDNFIHNNGQHGTVFNTPWGECIIDAGGYFFNTEAHPVDSGALHCCSRHLQEQLSGSLLDFDPSASMGEKLSDHRKRMTVEKEKRRTEEEAKRKKNTPAMQNKGGLPAKSVITETPISNVRVGKGEAIPLNTETNTNETAVQTQKDKDMETIKDSSAGYQVDQDHKNATSKDAPRTVIADKIEADSWKSATARDLSDRINFTAIFENIFKTEKKRSFEPQALLERIRKENRYQRNATWENEYHLLRCPAQAFLSRITLNGEFYEPLREKIETTSILRGQILKEVILNTVYSKKLLAYSPGGVERGLVYVPKLPVMNGSCVNDLVWPLYCVQAAYTFIKSKKLASTRLLEFLSSALCFTYMHDYLKLCAECPAILNDINNGRGRAYYGDDRESFGDLRWYKAILTEDGQSAVVVLADEDGYRM